MPMNAVADVSREPDAQDFEAIFRQLSPMVYRTARALTGRPEEAEDIVQAIFLKLIERELPGAGALSADELHTISAKSNQVLADMAPRAQWLESFVTGDKLYCVYIAEDEATVLEHAECGGFPANAVNQVVGIIDPTTGE